MPTPNYADAGIARYDDMALVVGPAELFNSAIPAPATEDFPVGESSDLKAFSVVGLNAAGNLALATYGASFNPAAQASNTLTFTGAGANGETVVIGSRTYTLRTALSTGPTVANEVLLGANQMATVANLAAAIMTGAGIGTTYSTGTLRHTDANGYARGAALEVRARDDGEAGNAIATTETATNASWAGASLAGGAESSANGVPARGITTAPVLTGVGGTGRIAIFVVGNFNPAALTWDASFDSTTKKLAAFRDAPNPTTIILRERL